MRTKKQIFLILFTIFVGLIMIDFIVCHILNSDVEIIDEFPIKSISVAELEEIVGIKFTEDAGDIFEKQLQILNNGGSFEKNCFYASETEIDIVYTISGDTMQDKDYYALKWDSETMETNNPEIHQIINRLSENILKKYNIDESMIQYVNIQYGNCTYEITDGVNMVDYNFYIFIIKSDENSYTILISGRYPYPIESEK